MTRSHSESPMQSRWRWRGVKGSHRNGLCACSPALCSQQGESWKASLLNVCNCGCWATLCMSDAPSLSNLSQILPTAHIALPLGNTSLAKHATSTSHQVRMGSIHNRTTLYSQSKPILAYNTSTAELETWISHMSHDVKYTQQASFRVPLFVVWWVCFFLTTLWAMCCPYHQFSNELASWGNWTKKISNPNMS